MATVLSDIGVGFSRVYFKVWRWFLWTAGLGALLPVVLLYVVLSLINSHPGASPTTWTRTGQVLRSTAGKSFSRHPLHP
jgi:hypothetical protein